MFQFGDDALIMENTGAPAVIWIQLLIVFLLISLLSSSVSLLSPDHPSPPATSTPPSSPPAGSKRGSSSTAVASCPLNFQEVHVLGASPTAGREASLVTSADADDVIGTRVVIRREEEERVRLDRSYSSSSMEEAPGSAYHRPWHCIRLAGMAFIKCFGLGSR